MNLIDSTVVLKGCAFDLKFCTIPKEITVYSTVFLFSDKVLPLYHQTDIRLNKGAFIYDVMASEGGRGVAKR